MTSPVPVISVDGPSAAGKGTLGRLLAAKLGYHYLDSGALYRMAGLLASRSATPLSPQALAQRLGGMDFRMVVQPESGAESGPEVAFWLGTECVTKAIRDEAISSQASVVASWPEVRDALRSCQRSARTAPGLVADGRDMGTRIFPDAHPKFFLTASLEARARRRYAQLRSQGLRLSLADVTEQLIARDRHDQNRPIAPLAPAADAITLDSTEHSIEEVLTFMLQEV